MNNFKKEINNLIKLSSIKKKKSAIFVGTTVKRSKFYFSKPIIASEFCYLTAIVFSNRQCEELCKLTDNKIDVIFYDLEKKDEVKTKKNTFNLERVVKEKIKESTIFPYKANDITVQASEILINNYFKKDIRGIGGKKVLIIGLGNIGSKLALKLTECGAKTFCFRRDKKSGLLIVNSINKIKPKNTIERSIYVNNFYKHLNNSDVIINCSSQINLIKKKYVDYFSDKQLVLDIGKGMFAKKALEQLIKKNKLVFRLDATPGYKAFLANYTSTKNNFNSDYFGRNVINGKTYISVGILGNKDEIVVDNPYNPKKIYGICDGKGNFKINE